MLDKIQKLKEEKRNGLLENITQNYGAHDSLVQRKGAPCNLSIMFETLIKSKSLSGSMVRRGSCEESQEAWSCHDSLHGMVFLHELAGLTSTFEAIFIGFHLNNSHDMLFLHQSLQVLIPA